MTLREALAQFDRWYLAHVLASSSTISEAARRAGLNRTHLYSLCARRGLALGRRQRLGNWRVHGL